jgi:uncharacterized protein YndB with AHSA1/START domain
VTKTTSGRSVVHASFAIERRYKAPPARVFAAWSDPKAKSAWFHGPDERSRENLELDFRVGGKEHAAGVAKDGTVHTYDAVYLDIVPDQRFILTYWMHINAAPISASLQTVELAADGAGTRLIFTEQAAFLDGYDDAGSREHGTRWLLEQLADEID